MDMEVRQAFNKFIEGQGQGRLRSFFDDLNTEDGIMLQSYFEDFGKSMSQQDRIQKLEAALESFPDMNDGRMSPERLAEAAREWYWGTMHPALHKEEEEIVTASFGYMATKLKELSEKECQCGHINKCAPCKASAYLNEITFAALRGYMELIESKKRDE